MIIAYLDEGKTFEILSPNKEAEENFESIFDDITLLINSFANELAFENAEVDASVEFMSNMARAYKGRILSYLLRSQDTNIESFLKSIGWSNDED